MKLFKKSCSEQKVGVDDISGHFQHNNSKELYFCLMFSCHLETFSKYINHRDCQMEKITPKEDF